MGAVYNRLSQVDKELRAGYGVSFASYKATLNQLYRAQPACPIDDSSGRRIILPTSPNRDKRGQTCTQQKVYSENTGV